MGLTVENLDLKYNSLQALFGISFDVPTGRTVAVLGPNGAGKSSLARAICGLVPPSGGHIQFNSEDITSMPAYRIHGLGVTYIPEGRGIFPSLSVLDNLRVAVWPLKKRKARDAALARSLDLFPALAMRQNQLAGTMSGGEQQMLALARAFCAESKLIVADELSLGLAPLIVDQVFSSLQAAKKEGMTLMIIEQFVNRALEMSDDCLILAHGKVVWQGSAASATDAVRDKYITQKAVSS
jgi:branched-chain amino acid transport system ATP-binding protein